MPTEKWTPDFWANSDPEFWRALGWYEAHGGGDDIEPPEWVRAWEDPLEPHGARVLSDAGLVAPTDMWHGDALTGLGLLALRWHRGRSAPAADTTPAAAPPKGDKLSAAIALKVQHPEWTAKRIAAEVGCSEPYLSQQPKWRAVVEAAKDGGRGVKPRSARHRGTDMDEYQAPERVGAGARCPCGDPAGVDADDRPLTDADGKPRCRDCLAELRARG